MAKSTVAPIAPARQAEPRTIPLSEVTITWPRRNDFEGDDERAPVVLTGKHLAQHVAWMARARGGRLGLSPDSDVFDETSVYLQLTGFSETLRALGYANTSDAQTDFAAVFAFLAEAAETMVAELIANHDAGVRLKEATVTIGPPAAEAK